ncbi:facilitated trehalose transporter Tret1-like isoform X1 [Leptopilina heterotoma]|uniref:facilitated trehalose transporter Tret1-like isoform X1 n=2 Tax=Leptopilina heterotoma TaxID=63436 RepID=UPI001CA7D9AE|nr:facilitated trehalose transporter Tret1-like isoform X1 [Leptopilina heterotoma]
MKLKHTFTCFNNNNNNNHVITEILDRPKQQKDPPKPGSRLLQFLTAINVSLIFMGCGVADSWTSPALPYLTSPESKIPVLQHQGSWVASLFNVGAIFGYIVYPLFIDRVGRKYSLLILFIPQLLSFILIYVAKSVELLYISRLIGGLGYCAGEIVGYIYIAEIAEKKIRGSLIILEAISYNVGSLIVVTIGAFFSYNKMNLISISLPLLFILIFPFLPESPYFRLKQNRKEEATKILSKLRGLKDPTALEPEINRIKEAIIEGEISKKYAMRKLFENKRHRKALFIVALVKASTAFSGYLAVSSYSQIILGFSGFSLDPKFGTIVLTLIPILFIIPTTPLVDYLGRRWLTLLSALICAVSLFFVGLFFFFKFYLNFADLTVISWVPLVALVIYKISLMGGIYSTSNVLASELFPVEVKSSAFAFISVSREILLFLVNLGFDWSIHSFGIYSVFWMYAVSCLALSLFAFIIMPETKGKNLEEIQVLLD